MKKVSFLSLVLLHFLMPVQAEESPNLSFSNGVDFCSRYVWRGLLFSDSPNIQPYMSVTWKSITAAAWGSYATSANYAEIDFFVSYTKKGFTLSLNDFFSENEADMSSTDFSQWKRELTNHLVEAVLIYEIPCQLLPFQITASSFVYGADLNEDRDQNFSSYFEVSYPFSFQKYDCSVFLGGTTHKGYYANDPGIVNMGFSAKRSLKISESLLLPVSTTLSLNPSKKDVFFVFSISII